MKNLFKYIAFLAFLYGLWYIVLGYFSFLLFFMFFCLIVICFLLSVISMRKTTVSMSLSQDYCTRDDTILVTFSRQNLTYIPCGQIVIEYQVMDVFSHMVLSQSVCLLDQQVEIQIPCSHCGHYIIQVQKIKCYDLLQCFSFSQSITLEQAFDVMPHYQEMETSVEQAYQFDEEGQSYLANQKGDDYSEVFEIRSYREGDALKHIHWNVSSKFQELFVKVGSQPIQHKLVLAMEYKTNNAFYDLQFDCFYSLCLLLVKKNIVFDVVTVCDLQQLHIESIHSLEEVITTTRWLMKNPIQTFNSTLMPKSFYQIHGQNLEVSHS